MHEISGLIGVAFVASLQVLFSKAETMMKHDVQVVMFKAETGLSRLHLGVQSRTTQQARTTQPIVGNDQTEEDMIVSLDDVTE